MCARHNANLLAAYQQLCSSYHAIDDFRAKLLGFLPLATGTGILALLKSGDLKDLQALPEETKCFLAATGVFGLLITLGLFAYEIYGIKKCSALIQAGQDMEESLHLEVKGQFLSRPQNVVHIINEPFAAGVIYPTVIAAWTFVALFFAWPKGNPELPIVVLLIGFAGTLIYDWVLRSKSRAAIRIVTTIAAPIDRCFDLARDIDFHTRTLADTGERAVAGQTAGLIGLGESVAWEARHLGFRQRFTAKVTVFDRPAHFRDEMTAGAFKSFAHDHRFEARDGETVMTDEVFFRSPLGPLGWLVDHLFMVGYLRRLLKSRCQAIKREAESPAQRHA